MNPDIENWLSHLNKNKNKKRKRNNDETDENDDYLINELRIMAIDSIEDLIKEYELSGRKLTIMLTNIEETLVHTKSSLLDTDINKEMSLMIVAYTSIVNEIIEEIKLESYTKGKKFNVNKFLKSLKTKYDGPITKKKKLSKINFEIEPPIKTTSIENKINDFIVEDSEYESTDDEDYDENDGKSRNKESEDESESGSEEENHGNHDYNKKGIIKDFLTEFKKSSDNKKFSKDEIMRCFSNLKEDDKKDLVDRLKRVNECLGRDEPVLFRILNMNVNDEIKKALLCKLDVINSSMGDNNKLKVWLDNAIKLPFGVYKGIDLQKIKNKRVPKFLTSLKTKMDNVVWGHDEAKHKIIQVMAQKIRNPECAGSVMGIWGPPGNGKTTLIKEGISKAMNKPFVFISLGGAQDSSFLEGHSYTYEGSIYGRIAQGIIASKCLDPIIYFDELDKVSGTKKGDEIINLLIHLIDPAQNSNFRDKYFHDINIDLSRVTFIFSFNDPSRVNYILLDRITCIETRYLTTSQKIHIAKNYLLPNILKDMGLNFNDICISDGQIKNMIDNFTGEGGVRKLKKMLYEICREINVLNLTTSLKLPINIDDNLLSKLLKNFTKYTPEVIHDENKVGIVNGLWAGSLGVGGILPIETMLIPTNGYMEIKATGSLEKVIKESIDVALSVAWNHIEDRDKNKWLEKWKSNPDCFHIHCPEGAVTKDGPSAGAAITLVFYSRLLNKKINNELAMTGEINLRGEVTKIGGLEEKLQGAKNAGVKIVLIPKENEDDLEKIKLRNDSLFTNDFKIFTIKNFSDVLKYSIV